MVSSKVAHGGEEDQRVGRALAEGGHEVVGQASDKAHGVGEQDAAPIGKHDAPRGRVEGGEEHPVRQHIRAREQVQERGLARRRVPHQCGGGKREPLTGTALLATGLLHLIELFGQLPDALADLALIKVYLALTAATAHANAALLALELGVEKADARQGVGQLCQLDLKLALTGAGTLGEDIEDDLSAVGHTRLQDQLKVALLGGGELIVEDHDGRSQRRNLREELIRLSVSYQERRVGGALALVHPVHHRDPCGAGELRKLIETYLYGIHTVIGFHGH